MRSVCTAFAASGCPSSALAPRLTQGPDWASRRTNWGSIRWAPGIGSADCNGRSNVPHITKKDRPLTPEHFAEFERCYGPDPNGRVKRKPADSKEDRWRSFYIDEIKMRDYKIDSLKWLKDESLDDGDELPDPEELATDAIAELESAVEELNAVIGLLENGYGAASAVKLVKKA